MVFQEEVQSYRSIESPRFTTVGAKHSTQESEMEAPGGFEPPHNGFADRPLKPLGYGAIRWGRNTLAGYRGPVNRFVCPIMCPLSTLRNSVVEAS